MVFKNIGLLLLSKRRLIIIHVLVWMIFIMYELSFVYLVGSKLLTFFDYFWAYLTNIVLFYLNVWSLKYCFEGKGKRYLYILFFLLEFAFYITAHFVVSQSLHGWKLPRSMFLSKIYFMQSVYRSIYFIGISLAYWFVLQLLKSNNLINKMETRHLIQQRHSIELERNLFKAKNAYLTSQINPHLLFNTLNFIYSSLYEVSKKSAEIVVLLSDMMRYSLTEIGEDGKVELNKEVEHIENMIQLNQARFNDQLHIKLYLSGDFEVRVIPLIFLTFIENVFKHGDMSDPAMPAKINISFHNNILDFYTANKVRKVNINRGYGIGVENSKTRLEMAYPDKYTLLTEQVGEEYITNLRIYFNE
jgi:two-component system LytT family sensor kinase